MKAIHFGRLKFLMNINEEKKVFQLIHFDNVSDVRVRNKSKYVFICFYFFFIFICP